MKHEFKVQCFFVAPFVEKINDSMQLDSNQTLASLRADYGNYRLNAEVLVLGHVRVLFRGNVYKCASQMPKELLDCYAQGKDPHDIDPDYRCDENNWFEEVFSLMDKDGNEVLSNDGWDSVVDSVSDTAQGWKDYLLETAGKLVEYGENKGII